MTGTDESVRTTFVTGLRNARAMKAQTFQLLERRSNG
jgi:hypothetical protein